MALRRLKITLLSRAFPTVSAHEEILGLSENTKTTSNDIKSANNVVQPAKSTSSNSPQDTNHRVPIVCEELENAPAAIPLKVSQAGPEGKNVTSPKNGKKEIETHN